MTDMNGRATNCTFEKQAAAMEHLHRISRGAIGFSKTKVISVTRNTVVVELEKDDDFKCAKFEYTGPENEMTAIVCRILVRFLQEKSIELESPAMPDDAARP